MTMMMTIRRKKAVMEAGMAVVAGTKKAVVVTVLRCG